MRLSLQSLSALLLLSPLTAGAMGISVIINGQTIVFKDVPQSTWFSTYVHDAATVGIVNGYQSSNGAYLGLFGPSDNVTIGQSLKVAIEGAGYQKDLYSSVIDAGVGTHWAAPYVAVAKAEHFPMVNGTLRLDRAATRAEVAAMIATAFRVAVDAQAGAGYKDVSPGVPEAQAIAALTRDKVVSGDTDANGNLTNTFRPLDFINRAEVVKMILLARATYGTPGQDREPDAAFQTQGTQTVMYTNNGFSPSVLHVKPGTTVTFKNDTTGSMRIQGTDTTGFFHSDTSVSQGGVSTFTFSTVGTWSYKNYLHPSQTATIIVEE